MTRHAVVAGYFDSQETPGTHLEQDPYATVSVNCSLSSHMVYCSWNGSALLLRHLLPWFWFSFLTLFFFSCKIGSHYAALGRLGLTENRLALPPEFSG